MIAMNDNSPKDLESFLQEAGLTNKVKSPNEYNLSLYHDLGIYGDEAESYIELLNSEYGVNTSQFVFKDYFPTEFSEGSWAISLAKTLLPFLRRSEFKPELYKRLTFMDISASIQKGSLE